ncbi:MAG: Rrf2 family transcriptional regulator [Candidatus Peribacteraceae bacterium]|nr:Rrf2 family transcriptional regulator [Candidatus Peribacteraceae bacterium]
MQFSKAAEYALLGLTHLAREKNFAASVSEIARAEKLSLYFLRNVFQKLRAAKLVNSLRGSGYTLAKKPRTISLKDVLDATEQTTTIHACLQKKATGCQHALKCKIVCSLARVQKNLDSELAKIHITDLI